LNTISFSSNLFDYKKPKPTIHILIDNTYKKIFFLTLLSFEKRDKIFGQLTKKGKAEKKDANDRLLDRIPKNI
jgi:hypothetical protein